MVASALLRRKILRLLETEGTPGTVRKLGVSREALVRLAAGLEVRAGTVALVEKALEAVDG